MSIFEKVKEEVRIADVVERYGVKLNSGDKALCPFHSEKTPSFSVSRKDNIFKCFGCGATGDAITFVSKIKGIDPLSAAKELANVNGVALFDRKRLISLIQLKIKTLKIMMKRNQWEVFLSDLGFLHQQKENEK